jgi:polysaccharide pyruvyl transferase CsaB
MPDRVLIAGYYGRRNAGDEAILAGMLADLRAERPDLEFTVVSGDPEATRRLHGVEAVPWSDLERLIDAVRAASLVLVGGGGLFHDYWGVDPSSLLTSRQAGIAEYGGPLVLARLLSKHSALYGVGVGPLRTQEGRELTRQLVALADGITVRDEASRQVLASIGCDAARVAVTADAAFGLPETPLRDDLRAFLATLPRPILGVSLRHWSIGATQAGWESAVAEALDRHLAVVGGTTLFVPLQDGQIEVEDDVSVSQSVMAQMRCVGEACLAPSDLDPLQRFRLLEHCGLVLGMRLHAVVAAVRGAVPCVGLAYDPKVLGLMEQAGWKEACLPLPMLRADALFQQLRDAWESRAACGEALATAGVRMREAARRNAAIALKAMSQPRQLREAEELVSRLALHQVITAHRFKGELAKAQASLEEAQRREERTRGDLEAAASETRRLQAELLRIRSSRGWRVLWAAWRVAWGIREQLGFLVPAVRPLLSLAERVKGFAVAAARGLQPRWLRRLAFASGPGAYVAEHNSTVVLYTDRNDLFPGYQPRRPLGPTAPPNMKVSLITTMKNEAGSVEEWFAGVEAQTRRPDEVIVVDAGSTDGSAERLEALAQRSAVPVRLLRLPGANIARGRNVAVEAALHPILAITDLGCSLPPDWLARIIVPFGDNPEIEVVAGWYTPEAHTALGRCAQYELVPRLEEISPARFLPSARSMAVRRDAWLRVGGDPEWLTLTGDDTFYDLELKRHSKAWAFVPDACVLWHAPGSLRGIWNNLYGAGKGDGESGVFARTYWRRLVRLMAGYAIAALGLLSSLAVMQAMPGTALLILAAALITVSLMGRQLVTHRGIRPLDMLWGIAGQHARSAGYLHGVLNRPVVARRRHAGITGTRIVLSGVAIDDSGGGQRAAQIAREWLRRGHMVVFLYRFPKNESVDLGIPTRHPRLLHWSTAEFDWEGFRWEYGRLLAENPPLVLVEFPLREYVPLARALRRVGAKVVYERIDDWRTSLGGSWYSPAVDRRIVAQADALTATAPSLARDLETISGRPVLLLPNAVDTHLFDPFVSHSRPADLPTARPIYLYVGSLWGDWFDWDLLLRVARTSPKASVVVIGDYRGQCPGSAPNLHFLGLKPQSELPAYLAHADVGILPWRQHAITAGTSPLKVYEYLAMGLPVVAPDLEALPQHRLVLRAGDAEGFIVALAQASALRTHPSETAAFRLEHGWQERVDELERVAEALRSGCSSKGETANSG